MTDDVIVTGGARRGGKTAETLEDKWPPRDTARDRMIPEGWFPGKKEKPLDEKQEVSVDSTGREHYE